MFPALLAEHGGSWFVHSIGSGIIHGLIYGVIYKGIRNLSFGETVMLAVAGIAAIGIVSYLWNRWNGRKGSGQRMGKQLAHATERGLLRSVLRSLFR